MSSSGVIKNHMLPPKSKRSHRRKPNSRNVAEIFDNESTPVYNTMPARKEEILKSRIEEEQNLRRSYPNIGSNEMHNYEGRRSVKSSVNSHKNGYFPESNESYHAQRRSYLIHPNHDPHNSPFFSNSGSGPTYVTDTEHFSQIREINERISRLEKLIWKVYKEVNHKIDNATSLQAENLEEVKDSVGNIFDYVNVEIETMKSTVDQTNFRSPEGAIEHSPEEFEAEAASEEVKIQAQLDSVIEEESGENESEEYALRSFCSSNEPTSEDVDVYDQESNQEVDEKRSDDPPEFYYSCHEKMVNNNNSSLLMDPRDIITAPNMSRTTLMDQIDYSLANSKLSEFSEDNKLAINILNLKKYNKEHHGSKKGPKRSKNNLEGESQSEHNISDILPLSQKVFKYSMVGSSL
ncbi:unnamed protein product [Moneuplotes crassus]|uniref:Uncharacterized protein n=1 Tax=Euplotes crassus TaxID=5936 RepID=A0AAD2DAF3_EUPCR|nr:unnamed protein product [Moneuplotes crassus]